MTEKSEALRLADALEHDPLKWCDEAATILRQLHEANEAFGKRQEWWNERMFVLEQQRDALLEAAKEAEPMLQAMLDNIRKTLPQYTKMPALDKLRAAIKAVEEGK